MYALYLYNPLVMKAFYVIFLLVFLASCGSEAIVSESPNVEQSQQETLEELDSEIESLSSDDDVQVMIYLLLIVRYNQ